MNQLETNQLPLGLSQAPTPHIFVNSRCVIQERDGLRVAVVSGAVFHTWPAGDTVAENLFVVQAKQLRYATVAELAIALERSKRSLFLAVNHYAGGGAAAVAGKPRGRPVGSGVDVLRDAAIRRLSKEGRTVRFMANHLGTSSLTVTRALTRMGLSWKRNAPRKAKILPLLSDDGTPLIAEPSLATEGPIGQPDERRQDQTTSANDAPTRLESGSDAPATRAGEAAESVPLAPAHATTSHPSDAGESHMREVEQAIPGATGMDEASGIKAEDHQVQGSSAALPETAAEPGQVPSDAHASPAADDERAEERKPSSGAVKDVEAGNRASGTEGNGVEASTVLPGTVAELGEVPAKVYVPHDREPVPPSEENAASAEENSQEDRPQPPSAGSLERSWDVDPSNRTIDRLRASQGALLDAPPLFASGRNLPFLGVLLAIPFLVQSGVLDAARQLYPRPRAAFFGLRTTLLVVILLSLLRLKRPEHLKEYSPAELGRVLGLDRVPEVKTLRRKLTELAEGPGEELLLALARLRVEGREDALAWLYVDGHVRVYHGKEKVPSTHVTRLRIAARATQDIWVHDGDGRPFLMVTQEAHPSLATALLPIMEAVREVTGPETLPTTVVFDRGGWSPSLFKKLVGQGVDILTYRKGDFKPVPVEEFQPRQGRPGEPPWQLHDAPLVLKNGLALRQITRLVGEHQTAIVTSRQDLPAEVLAARMFDRWRQENFFKYMRQEFDLDGLIEHGAEPEDPRRETPNPEWNRRDRALKAAKVVLQKALAKSMDPEHPDVVAASAKVSELQEQRRAVPRRVLVGDMTEPTVRLLALKKRLYDGLKTVAYQIETDLLDLLTPFYARAKEEGRTLIASAFRTSGSLEVTPTELIVTLNPQSSPHRTAAVAELCRLMDETSTCFPGTALRLRYRVVEQASAPQNTA